MRIYIIPLAIVLITLLAITSCNKKEEEPCTETRAFWFDGSIANAQFESSPPCGTSEFSFARGSDYFYADNGYSPPYPYFAEFYSRFDIFDGQKAIGAINFQFIANVPHSLIDSSLDSLGYLRSKVDFEKFPAIFDGKEFSFLDLYRFPIDTVATNISFEDKYGQYWNSIVDSTNYISLLSYEGQTTLEPISGVSFPLHLYRCNLHVLLRNDETNETIIMKGVLQVGFR